MKLIYIILFALSIISCQHEATLTNVYVGCYRMHDQHIAVPNLFAINDGEIQLISAAGKVIDHAYMKTGPFVFGDSIMFEHSPQMVQAVTSDGRIGLSLKNDTSRMGRMALYTQSYYRSVEDRAVDLKKIEKTLQRGRWSYTPSSRVPNRDLDIEHELVFNKMELLDVTINRYDGIEVHRESKRLEYIVFDVEGQVFLSLNPTKADENPFPIFHIVHASNDEVIWIRNDDRFPEEERLTMLEVNVDVQSANNQSSEQFDLCFNAAVGEYYYGDINHLEGNQYLINLVNESLPASEINGYINIHFHINCRGQVGEIGLEQMDFQYKSTQYQNDVVQHLIKKVVSLDRWPPIIRLSDRLEYKDVHAFLMFKFKDGKIIDLCP